MWDCGLRLYCRAGEEVVEPWFTFMRACTVLYLCHAPCSNISTEKSGSIIILMYEFCGKMATIVWHWYITVGYML